MDSLVRSASAIASSREMLRVCALAADARADRAKTRGRVRMTRLAATPGARDACWPGTGRQRRRAEPHGAQKGLDVPRRSVFGRLRKSFRHHFAIERVAE